MVWLSSANTCDSLSKQTTVALFLSKNGDAEDEPNVQTYRENNDSEHHYRAVPHHLHLDTLVHV